MVSTRKPPFSREQLLALRTRPEWKGPVDYSAGRASPSRPSSLEPHRRAHASPGHFCHRHGILIKVRRCMPFRAEPARRARSSFKDLPEFRPSAMRFHRPWWSSASASTWSVLPRSRLSHHTAADTTGDEGIPECSGPIKSQKIYRCFYCTFSAFFSPFLYYEFTVTIFFWHIYGHEKRDWPFTIR